MLKKTINQLQPFLSNVYIRGSGILLATCVSDFIWAQYISTIASKDALAAATWGSVVIILGAYVTISYVGDRRLIVPAAIGAFIGTYFAV